MARQKLKMKNIFPKSFTGFDLFYIACFAFLLFQGLSYLILIIWFLFFTCIHRLSFSFEEEKINQFVLFTNFKGIKVSQKYIKTTYLIAYFFIIFYLVLTFKGEMNNFISSLFPISLAFAVGCRKCILAIKLISEKGLIKALSLNEKFYSSVKSMKPINDLAFNNICLDFSCSCMNFCSEATYITMEEIAHDCNPIHYEEEEVENNFIENIVLKIYKMVMNKEDFKEYIAQYLYPAIEIRWESHKRKKNNPTIEAPTSLSYFTSYDYEDFEENFDSFLEDIDYDFLNKYLKRCWDRACITDKPFSLEEVIEMLISDGNKGKILSPKSNK